MTERNVYENLWDSEWREESTFPGPVTVRDDAFSFHFSSECIVRGIEF